MGAATLGSRRLFMSGLSRHRELPLRGTEDGLLPF